MVEAAFATVKDVLVAIAVTLVVKSTPPEPAPGIVIKSPTFKSNVNVVLKPFNVVVAELELIVQLPPSVREVSNTKSAVKSAPVFGEFIKNDFTSSKFLDVIAAIVTAALLEFSIC